MTQNNTRIEVSKDKKTISFGEHSAQLKRRLMHKFWCVARWEIPLNFPDGTTIQIHVAADKIDSVENILVNHAKLVDMSEQSVSDRLQYLTEQALKNAKL